MGRCGGVEETLENESIENLSEILYTEILSRMANFYNQCEDYYFVEKGEAEPKIKCIRCKVGRHNCDNKIIDNEIMNVAGVYWFCDECAEYFMIEYISKFDKNAHFKGFKENEKNKENKITKKDDTTKIKDKKKQHLKEITINRKKYRNKYQTKNKKKEEL